MNLPRAHLPKPHFINNHLLSNNINSCSLLQIWLIAWYKLGTDVDLSNTDLASWHPALIVYVLLSHVCTCHWNMTKWLLCVEASWNVMAHAQKPDFVFRRNGRVHWNRRGRQFNRLLAAEVCVSAVVMLDTPCSEVEWRVLATHSIRQFPLHFPSRASLCTVTFQLQSTTRFVISVQFNPYERRNLIRCEIWPSGHLKHNKGSAGRLVPMDRWYLLLYSEASVQPKKNFSCHEEPEDGGRKRLRNIGNYRSTQAFRRHEPLAVISLNRLISALLPHWFLRYVRPEVWNTIERNRKLQRVNSNVDWLQEE